MLDLKPYSPERLLNLEGLPSEPYAILFAHFPGCDVVMDDDITFTVRDVESGKLSIEYVSLCEQSPFRAGNWICTIAAKYDYGYAYRFEHHSERTPLLAFLLAMFKLTGEAPFRGTNGDVDRLILSAKLDPARWKEIAMLGGRV